MNSQPLVSIIIPIYNQANFIENALKSIQEQSYKNSETIIIDDGSTDSLQTKLQSLPYHYVYIFQKNQGAAAARNRGIQMSKGHYLAFLDADDQWPSNRLSIMVKYFEDQPEAEVVSGHIKDSKGKREWLPSFGSTLVKKSVFYQVGTLNEQLRYSEDQDWFLRCREERINLSIIDAITLLRTINPKSQTYNKNWKELNIHQVLKMSLDRRRSLQEKNPLNLKRLKELKK